MANILVLSGGSVKGAFQVGALKRMIENGFYPDKIYGISVGSLNGAMLSYYYEHFSKLSLKKDKQEIWQDTINFIENYWINNINSPSSIINKNALLDVAVNSLINQFDGLTTQKPLKDKIETLFFQNGDNKLKDSPIELKIGAVDINTGKIHYVSKEHQYFKSYLLASSAIPMIMQTISIHIDVSGVPAQFTDGGVVDVVPTRIALAENTNGTDNFYIISCHPNRTTNSIPKFNRKNILDFIERIIDIMNFEITQNDLELMINSNRNYTLVRPNDHLPILTENFNQDKIKNLIALGFGNDVLVG